MSDTTSTPVEGVVLLHGLARTRRSMKPIERFLSGHGYATANLSYPSQRYCIEDLATQLRPRIEEATAAWQSVHYVTHSMGGIILRQLMAQQASPRCNRCVMLCPPNQGSQVVDRLGDWRLFKLINGPGGQQLSTAPTSLPRRLGRVDFELGVIAGDRSVNPLLSRCFDEPNDGKVAVRCAHVDGERDFLQLPIDHTFTMRYASVQGAVLSFLRNGYFSAPNG